MKDETTEHENIEEESVCYGKDGKTEVVMSLLRYHYFLNKENDVRIIKKVWKRSLRIIFYVNIAYAVCQAFDCLHLAIEGKNEGFLWWISIFHFFSACVGCYVLHYVKKALDDL